METRTPDDYELFLENILEAPRGQRKVWNGKCYNAAYKCDPTINKYTCAGGVCKGPNGTCLPAAPGFGLPPGGGGPALPTPLTPVAPLIPPSGTGATMPPAELPSVGTAPPAVGAAPAAGLEPGTVNLPLPPVPGAPIPPG
jgi:pilus assembly protein CpaC